jgi:type III secretion protein J
MTGARLLVLLGLLLSLTACKIELYNGLNEEEANQMLALLILRNIDADKQMGKSGDISLRVEKEQFVNAVELLRQNGYPKRKTDTMADLFPSGQLVTSPTQEQAKMLYLKEQQLEKMLNSMDGVIQAQVSIADSGDKDNNTPMPSAAVFIKYSPDTNLANREAEIKSLIHDGVPNLRPENISVVLQAADYRYVLPKTSAAPTAIPTWQRWLASNQGIVLAGIATLAVVVIIGLIGLRSLSRKSVKDQKHP